MRPILITGAGGTLGSAVRRICEQRGLAYVLTTRRELDIASRDSVHAALERYEPWLVINAAGYVRVDDAERDHERCRRENVLGPEILARACSRARVQMVLYSSDLVFDGAKTEPYEEHDKPSPLGVYGRTKYEAEQRVLDGHPGALVVRTSAFFGPWDDRNFVTATLRGLAAGRTVRAADDTTMSPTYVPDLVHACLDLAIDGETGIWHLANIGAMTWAALARAAARTAGYAENLVIGVSMRSLGLAARRPRFSALGSTRGLLLPRVDHALDHYHGTRKDNR
jgi:dTDP-4-dehydrorhamnose reductase